ncbi:response regulator [Paenibacillus chartarius]|uniref:histidine kinase n=1 Tax=Paenibacillus chartarius TaxID=747481 RepID=A0ABV6DG00_9BACL
MKFRTKLMLGFGFVLLSLLVVTVCGFSILNTFKFNMNLIVNEKYAGVKLAVAIRGEVNHMTIELSNALLDTDNEQLDAHVKAITESNAKIGEAWGKLQSLASRTNNAVLMTRLGNEYGEYAKALETIGALLQKGDRNGAVAVFYSDTEPKRKALFASLAEFNSLYDFEMEQALSSTLEIYRSTLNISILLIAILLIAAVAIVVWVFLSVTGRLKRVSSSMAQVSLGNSSIPRIPVTSNDEIGAIAVAFNDMAEKLEHQAQKEKDYQLALEERASHQAKLAELSDLLQGVQELQPLAQQFLNQAAPLIGAGYAVCYVRSSQDRHKPVFQRTAVYGGPASELQPDDTSLRAEGLAAQCGAENRPIRMDQVPEGYIRIRSGLGHASPAHLLIMPVPYEDHAIAVLEFAFFEHISPAAYALLEETVVNLGVALNGALSYQEVQRLFKETQSFAEELQTQSEELQLQQEELRTLNEQLEEQYKNSERRNKELESLRLELEEQHQQVLLHSQYKTEFLANVSHELRTPLNSLLLLAQHLCENKDGNLKPKQIEYLKTIHASGHDLLQLINEILDLSKIESGKMQVVCETITLKELGAGVREQFQPVALQKGLDFRIEYDGDIETEEIHTDIYKLRQILHNLLSNAYKFTEKGSVKLAFRCSSAGADGQAACLNIEVSDTGIGIPQDKHSMIFESFRQADGTTSRKYGGTGLGLSISKELAALLGGRIALTSEVGKGSIFILTIPMHLTSHPISDDLRDPEAAAPANQIMLEARNTETADKHEEENKKNSRLAGRKILLVDDDMRNIFALTGVLEEYGMTVIFAENGLECLDMLERHSDTDLVLMDMMMPKMDGYETIRAIREGASVHKDIPVIALTAKAMKHDREKCIEAGANDYISKPTQVEQLLSLLRVWLHPQGRRS